DTVGDGISSSPTSSKPHTDQRSVFTFSSLPTLLVMESLRPQHHPSPIPTNVVCLRLVLWWRCSPF
ncbi:hypothetical protein pdam_00023824, partial [Pocillopora damicornis]